jgi:hypothetical protein
MNYSFFFYLLVIISTKQANLKQFFIRYSFRTRIFVHLYFYYYLFPIIYHILTEKFLTVEKWKLKAQSFY